MSILDKFNYAKRIEEILSKYGAKPYKIEMLRVGDNDKTKITLNGHALSLLIALAGATNHILKQVDLDKDFFDDLLDVVGVESE